MRNKITIIILLSLVAMVGQAQVKSGLDLCLRDEATGEWLIGLFDDYAIYDCNYWDYAEAEKGRVVLTKDGMRKEVRLKKNTAIIDGKKHKTSALTSAFLPDYPTKDETAWTNGIPGDEGQFTLRVCVRTTKKGAEFVSYIMRLLNSKQIVEYSKMDEQGRFEVKMPVSGPTVMGIFNDCEIPTERFFSGELIVENDDTLLLYVDDVNHRAFVMGGKHARFNNELLACNFHPDFVMTERLPMDSTIVLQRREMEKCQARIDSLNFARPNLSHRFNTFIQDNIRNEFAYPMLLKCWLTSDNENPKELISKAEAELNPLQWMRSEVPLMCRSAFSSCISYYTTALTDVSATELPAPEVMLLRLCQEGKIQLSEEEMKKVKDFHELLTHHTSDVPINEIFHRDIIPILGKPLIAQYWDWELTEHSVPLEISVLNSLPLDDVTREILKAQTFMKNINGKSNVASPRVMELAHQEIHHPRFMEAIDNANQSIKDFLEEQQRQQKMVAQKAGTPASLRVSEDDLKDLTDGQALFERIIAPFRGYVVYVDVWGTWCGPCRSEMEAVPTLKKMLEGKPIVYLYFCNNSPEDAWRSFINQKHLDTDNAIHYNLPRAQENAIERYLEVSGFPTYRLVDTSGRLMPGSAPRPSTPNRVTAIVEQLIKGNRE